MDAAPNSAPAPKDVSRGIIRLTSLSFRASSSVTSSGMPLTTVIARRLLIHGDI